MQKETLAMADQMRQHIEACKESGLYVAEYCKLNQVRPSSYYYWRKKLLGAARPKTGAFIQLQPSAPVGCVEVVFASGVKVYFDNLVPAEYLKQLLS